MTVTAPDLVATMAEARHRRTTLLSGVAIVLFAVAHAVRCMQAEFAASR